MRKVVIFCAIAICSSFAQVYGVGSIPVPQVTDVSFTASAEYDPATERFTYHYAIASGPSNQGDINFIFIDIKRRSRAFQTPPADFQFSVPSGFVPTVDEMEVFQNVSTLPFGTTIETLSTDLPLYWGSSPTADGYLLLAPPTGGILDANGEPMHADLISPGESFDGLTVTALTAPTLREVIIVPDWELVVENPEALTDEIIDQGNQVLQDILIKTTTIGPEYVNYGGGLLERVIDDVDKMVQLGWISDIALITSIQTLLTEASVLKSNNDGSAAKVKLQQVIDLMASVTEVQMRREAIDLISINIPLVVQSTADTFIPPDLVLTVEPQDSRLEIGQTVIFNPKLIDRARNNQVVFSFDSYSLEVLSGPHAGLTAGDIPGSELGYTGTKTGTDIVEITREEILALASNGDVTEILMAALGDPDSEFLVQARVTWTGGPDYVISFFSPPFLDYEGAETIWIHEETKNIGTTDGTGITKTRYYLSSVPDIDTSTAYQLHERIVDPLAVDAESKSGAIELVWPSQFPPGRYYFAACVDAADDIVELNENNNCSFHQVDRVAYVVGVISLEEPDIVNTPPVCDEAVASVAELWPPNHKFVNIAIEGVKDIDQDEVLITITGITQDEPVNGISSGSTSPDGKGVGTPFAQVRAERDGTGDGRVYAIQFKATDTAGNECSGEVRTSAVVHDKSKKSMPAIDSGQVYDSTIEFN